MHFNDPIDENSSHFLVDVLLIFHVRPTARLLSLHISQTWPQVLCAVEDIILLHLITLFDVPFLHLVDDDDPEMIETTL